MLEGLFGNKTAEKVLLNLFHYGENTGSGIRDDWSLSLTAVQNQLQRFEQWGLLVSKTVGRAKLYQFNPKFPFYKSVLNILKIAYDAIPQSEKSSLFKERRRPRMKGKPVL